MQRQSLFIVALATSLLHAPVHSQSMMDAYNQQKSVENERFNITRKCDRGFTGVKPNEVYCINKGNYLTRCEANSKEQKVYCFILGTFGEKNIKGKYTREYNIVKTNKNGDELYEFWCTDGCTTVQRKFLGIALPDAVNTKHRRMFSSIPESVFANKTP